MSTEIVNYYERGETYRGRLYVRDDDGNLIDASTATYEIYDPSETLKDSGNMTHVSTGTYECYYDIPSDAALGEWSCVCTVTSGAGRKTIVRGRFVVVEKV